MELLISKLGQVLTYNSDIKFMRQRDDKLIPIQLSDAIKNQ